MSRKSMGMVKLGTLGALTGLVLVPAISSKGRKKISRTTRNAYFRVADFVQDLKDMTSR